MFFLSFVKLWHCQKTWSGVSSDVPHVQIPFGTILKRAKLRQGCVATSEAID
jgi:hypothetical protein